MKERITLSLNAELLEKLKLEAASQHRNVSQQVELILTQRYSTGGSNE